MVDWVIMPNLRKSKSKDSQKSKSVEDNRFNNLGPAEFVMFEYLAPRKDDALGIVCEVLDNIII